MQLNIWHGRKSIDEHMEDWGFEGPTITGIKAIKWTYDTPQICFCDEDACKAAKSLTGWQEGVYEHALDMLVEDGMLKLYDGKIPSWYGDWELLEVV